MPEFMLDDLKRIMREGAGDAGSLDGDVTDVPFADLGYDSLAMFETVSRIGREFDVALPDRLATEATTPRGLMDVVNALLPAASA